MALKSFLFVFLMVSGLAVPSVAATLGGLGDLLGLIRIQGTVYCTANGNTSVNGTATPVFPNALVQLQCGTGNVVSSATTNSNGVFSIVLDAVQFLLTSLLSRCNLLVPTPLSTCNATLPAGGILSSPLQFIGQTSGGLLSITNIIPAGFNLLP